MTIDKKEKNKFAGVFTALVSPFYDGELDTVSLEALVANQLENGIEGFVVNGTTGESPTLSASEVERIVKTVRTVSAGRVPILLGTGSASTEQALINTKRASELKVDGVLVVVPYYNKPPQRGLVLHFSKIAQATDLPVVLYNVPSRTITSLSLESVIELSRMKNIVGLKEASGDFELARQILRSTPNTFCLTSGDDETCMDLARLGAHGVISVASHIFPKIFVESLRQARNGQDTPEFDRLKPAIRSLYWESNPIPIKQALFKKGLLRRPELRLPLTEMSESQAVLMLSELVKTGSF